MGAEVSLGKVQETLLIPLYGRCLDARKKRSILRDTRAAEMVEGIDYDFGQHHVSNTTGSVWRASIFDAIVGDFLDEYPDGTVVDLGCGLSTRFQRLDNGRVRWVDVDLADVIALRRQFFADGERYTQRAASIFSTDWYDAVDRSSPMLLLSEAVLLYFPEDEVRAALRRMAADFPGARLAFDTAGKAMIDAQDKTKVYDALSARFEWVCDDPRALEDCGLRLTDSYTFAKPPARARRSWPAPVRVATRIGGRFPMPACYRFNVFQAAAV